MESLAGWMLGLLFGMRHALEPDHLAAVSTLVAEDGRAGRGALLGAFWGAGHTLALLAAGTALAVLQSQMPERLSEVFELGVAVLLLWLGVRAMVRALRKGTHARGAAACPHEHVELRYLPRWTICRPVLAGIVHGLAGSGALTALVFAGLPSNAARLAYLGLFGLGSVMGMALLSGLAGWPLARAARSPRAGAAVAATAGAFSAGMGVLVGWPLVQRLLSGTIG
jgi:high-affinity nickel-transport protein